MSADNGNSEAQWKYAQMNVNGLGTRQNSTVANEYFRKSVEQKDIEGMLRYALFIRHLLLSNVKTEFELVPFEDFIEKCAELGNIEAIHQLGISYESNFSRTDEIDLALEEYTEATDNGHIESFIRLAQLVDAIENDQLLQLEQELDEDQIKYSEYLKYSIGLFNTQLMVKYLENLNKEKNYTDARKLIDVGMTIDPDVFTAYLAENIAIFCPNGQAEYEQANILLNTYINKYEQENISKDDQENNINITEKRKIWSKYEKYVMVKLLILIANSRDNDAAMLLMKFKDCLSSKSKDDFVEFYRKLDKQIAKQYYITINYYLPDCREIAEISKNLKSDTYAIRFDAINKLKTIVQENPNNSFALLKLGKLYMKGMTLVLHSDPTQATDLIQRAAQNESPEARFACGKIYFYGFDCAADTAKAFTFFWKAFDENNRDPRAGYYLSDERFLTTDPLCPNEFTNPIIITREKQNEYLCIAAEFGYRKALYKLGLIYFSDGNPSISAKGLSMIMQAKEQGYEAAEEFIKKNSLKIKNNNHDMNTDESFSTTHTEELYHPVLYKSLLSD